MNFWKVNISLGVIHKPCGHGQGAEGGEWVYQMSMLLHKPYLHSKLVHKGGGGRKCSKICPDGLWTAP